jgi:hypothetical protein
MQDDQKPKGSESGETVNAIAARCLDDPAFARQILVGDEYATVRNAIIADLEEARSSVALNPQPLPPGETGLGALPWVKQEKIWSRWSTLRHSNLKSLLARE